MSYYYSLDYAEMPHRSYELIKLCLPYIILFKLFMVLKI